ncbi:hypothetical protein CLV62_10649 [Dysgonomonas alginatilytica]|uniref:BACON domain-containing protein n=1 Tax=Dysgonomonas alginatilytica TaxID=1605892 RepID=A0A2V3PSL2_9BACT|nr:BACON domain-containing protein [Dysgonomonas alginatilytica]PXV65876.1 hypothetical protein CLV62_10649 [Dysgonomonas alginatilytica]
MKNNFLIFSLLLFLLSSCDGKEDSIQSEFIQLSQKEISFDHKEGKDTIGLRTNTSWEIENVPEWLTVSKQKGTQEDTDVIIVTQANNQSETREFELIFQTKYEKIAIHIYQEAKPKPEYTLPWLGFADGKLVSGTYSETEPFDLEFETDELFINASNKELIFPGSLFAGNLTNYPKLDAIKGYIYNPMTITIGSITNFTIEENYMPTYETYQKIEKEGIDKFSSNANLSMPDSYGEYYYSRRHLHCIGLSRLGISLEELLNGKTYKEESMKHEYGLIYRISNIKFNTIMDFPYPSLLKNELNKDEFTPLNPNYISEINYTNNTLLLVESDFDRETVNSIKLKLNKNEQLNNDEITKAKQMDAYYLYLVSVGEFKVIKGNLIEVANQLKNQAVKAVIVPTSFTFTDYYNGAGVVNYKIHVE